VKHRWAIVVCSTTLILAVAFVTALAHSRLVAESVGTPVSLSASCSPATAVATPRGQSGPAVIPPPPCASPATPVVDRSATEVVIRIVDFRFDPGTIEVKIGTTVTWVNDGPTDHTTVAFAGGKKRWDSNILHAGDEYSLTFNEPGSFDYVCGLHPTMKAHVDVVE